MRYSNFKDKIKSNANKISYFVEWYVDTATKDRNKDNYNKDIKNITGVEYEYAMEEWLVREDVQEAVKAYMQQKKNIKIFDIYNAMYDKAVTKGDVNAAKWMVEFTKSDFFGDEKDEMDSYLSGIDIPALKKSGDN